MSRPRRRPRAGRAKGRARRRAGAARRRAGAALAAALAFSICGTAIGGTSRASTEGVDQAPPYHGSLESVAWGGHGELRFGYDVTAGVSAPEWFSVGQVGGFFLAKLGSRLRLSCQAAYDRGADDFVLERAELIARVGRTKNLHAGILLAPLGATNLEHDAPEYEFAERSLVATQIIGVPNAELGVGLRGSGRLSTSCPYLYELDVVTGFDDGLIMDASGGTRLPAGRNNYGDQNGLPALAGRIAFQPAVGTNVGLSLQSGPYNQTEVGDSTVDRSRFVHLLVLDTSLLAAGFSLSGEGAFAMIDVAPGLDALYAERQWGASVEAVRPLRTPIIRPWRGSSLSTGLRAEKVDFDTRIPGDSRTRLSASLNVRPHPYAILRFGWYYEWQRDRFNNTTPLAGLTLTAASSF